MNKKLLYLGIGMYSLEIIPLIIYVLILNLTLDIFTKIIFYGGIGFFNILALIFIIVGLIKENKK
jgi:hypothetical protein